jgi:hypothetical protein
LKSSIQGKLCLDFLTFDIQILQTTLDGEMIRTKVIDLKKLWNYVVDTFSFETVEGPKYIFQNQVNIKWGGWISEMDTSVFMVEWLGKTRESWGSGFKHRANMKRASCEKLRDFWQHAHVATRWGLS